MHLDEAFAAIQVHEANIEHARVAAANPALQCEATCTAPRDAETAAAALCELARSVADPDALARCEAAKRSVVTIGADAALRCTCAEPGG